jgi:hypothetical protein
MNLEVTALPQVNAKIGYKSDDTMGKYIETRWFGERPYIRGRRIPI